MSKLFGKAKSTINEHIKNVYKEGELIEKETMTKFGISEFADKPTNYYNLDMIISVGYRVKSQNGILFRKWATSVLKDYMLKGYAVNQKRLEYLEKTIKLIDIANRIDERLEGNDAKEIFIKVLHGQDIYKSIEEKGANFLYLIVKNHVFADGNKRIAATLFIYFLNFYRILYKNGKQVIDNNTLTALTLLIA